VKLVSVTNENKNQIIWEVPETNLIQYFHIYRESKNENTPWIKIGNVPYQQECSFVDVTSFPSFKEYAYQISSVDICQNESPLSNIHKPIRLEIDKVDELGNILNWSQYEGNIVLKYNIYRGTQLNNLSLVDSTSSASSSYSDLSANKDMYYQVEAILEPHLPHKDIASRFVTARSNIVNSKNNATIIDSIHSLKIMIYPNPLRTSSIVFFSPNEKEYILSIFDLSGKVAYTEKLYCGETIIERRNLKNGIYILQVKEGNKFYHTKLVVQGN
jgi:hypothetical protein